MHIHRLLIATMFCIPMVIEPAEAGELNAEEVQTLLFEGTWKIQVGAGHDYFIWNSDGTLCVKLYDPNDEACDDHGTWTLDGATICYEVQWWGKAEDLHRLCFDTVEIDSGEYDAVDFTGLSALRFSVGRSE